MINLTDSASVANKLQQVPDDVQLGTMMHAPFAVAWFDTQGHLLDCNHAFHVKANFDTTPSLVNSVHSIFPSINTMRWSQLLQELSEEPFIQSSEQILTPSGPSTTEITLRAISQNKNQHYIALFIGNILNDSKYQGIQTLQHEVLEAVAVGKPLNILMETICTRVEALAPEVVCTVLLVDNEGKVHPCSAPSMPDFFSVAIDNEPIGPQAGSCGTAAWRGEAVEVTDIANDPLWVNYKDLALSIGLLACWSNPIFTRDGRVVGTFALYYREKRGASDFHRQMVEACVHLCSLAIEHEESEKQIYHLAFHDPLTGLANRMLLRDRAMLALQQVKQRNNSLTVLFMDLDRFKTINDSLGHSLGDQLLKTVADRLRQQMKPADTIARLGGDEFIILLTETNASQARVIVERLLKNITTPIVMSGVEIAATASVGLSVAPDDDLDFENLLKNADVAMYKAKAAGRNTYQFFQKHMNDLVVDRITMESALRRAISERELEVYYQPQINIISNEIYGLEALVRWQHPERGLISPDTFIPLAEEMGLISEIDQWVIEEGCRQCVEWRKQGIDIKHLSVNLSAADFLNQNLLPTILQTLAKYQLATSCLTLEITEGLMLNSVPDTVALLDKMSEIGLGLAVDDFGTGYSSLSYIKQFPINELKVDQSFVKGIADDEGDRALAHAIIQMGAILNLTVVAEGVETAQQLEIIRNLGCPVVQGYHFCKPLPAEALNEWLQQSKFIQRA
ncbi:Phytochrome-like protein cph2 [Thalassocella blandensis]|nr:Phytochrome-like protein cph2 [Thalassocella blandensis]